MSWPERMAFSICGITDLFKADDAGEKLLALPYPPDEVAAHLFFYRRNPVARSPQLPEIPRPFRTHDILCLLCFSCRWPDPERRAGQKPG